MSTKKEKLIEEAQRFAMRGQLDKAIAAYRQILSIDSSAINHRQRLAELLVKSGKFDEARSEFENIGKHYASNGFYLKSIAVYKQVQKLFPADISLSLTLAGLNDKHGLTANALAEYKTVADYYEKNNQPDDVIKILEKMQSVDSGNINVRLKLAEAYFQVGQLDHSYKSFGKLASILQERGDSTSFNKLNFRIQKLFPQKSTFMLEVLEEQILAGQAGSAVAGLQSMLRTNPNDKRVWDLVIAAYTSLKQPQKLKSAYTHYLKFFPEDFSAQSGLITCMAVEGDLNGVLELLSRYESGLLNSGYWKSVVEIYQLLEALDPINLHILEGLERAFRVGDKLDAVALLIPKIKSLKNLESESSHSFDLQNNFDNNDFAPLEPAEPFVENSNDESIQNMVQDNALSETLVAEKLGVDTESPFDEEIEIDIDFDDISDFKNESSQASEPDLVGDNWLDSVGEIFDSVATAPRGVKFGDAAENVDSQSHYDLGVAFKEMGLYDEAINEFRQAAVDNRIKIACLVLQGSCFREKGEVAIAENMLRTLMKPGLKLGDTCSVKYELALTCAVAGKQEESSVLLKDIELINPGFRDVRRLLDAAVIDESSLDFSDEELQGFDLK